MSPDVYFRQLVVEAAGICSLIDEHERRVALPTEATC